MIERDLTFTYGSTGRSAGGLRQQFSGSENIRLSQFTLSIIRRLKEEFGPEADVGFKEQGYLILASEKGVPILEQNVATQAAADALGQEFLEGRLAFPDEVRGWQQFFIAWRRLAGGLSEAMQSAFRDAMDPIVAPPEAKLKKPKR